eukprot:355198-Chlamydomonas_euryale.AAC.5
MVSRVARRAAGPAELNVDGCQDEYGRIASGLERALSPKRSAAGSHVCLPMRGESAHDWMAARYGKVPNDTDAQRTARRACMRRVRMRMRTCGLHACLMQAPVCGAGRRRVCVWVKKTRPPA